MRGASPYAKTLPLYMHDGFDLNRFSDFVAGRPDFVVQDHHSYFVFTDSDRMEKASQHTADVRGGIAEAFSQVSDKQHRNLVIDEWSCALDWKSLQNEPSDDVEQDRNDFCMAQLDVYTNTTAGWGFWCKFFLFMFCKLIKNHQSRLFLQRTRKRIAKMIRIGVLSLQLERRGFHRPSSRFRRSNLIPLPILRHGVAIGLRLAHSIIALNLSNIGEIECGNSILRRCHHRKVIPMVLRRPRFSPRTICQSLGLLASI